MTVGPAPESSAAGPDESSPTLLTNKQPGLALTFLLPFLLLLIPGSLVMVVATSAGASIKAGVTIVEIGAVFLPTAWLYRHYRRRIRDDVAPRVPAPGPMASLLLFLAGLIVFGDTFMYMLMQVAPESLVRHLQALLETQAMLMDNRTAAEWIWFFAVIVLGAGIFEELLFRGLILRASLRRFTPGRAALLNGFLFAVMHQNALAALYYFALGSVLAWVAMRTGTLIYGIVLHCTLNFSAVILYRLFGDLLRLPVPIPFALAGGLAACALGLWLFTKTYRSDAERVSGV